MRNTLYRQWAMLRLVPRHPRKITVRELHERLRAEDDVEGVSRRTLERDLQELSAIFPLEQTDLDTKPTAWRWRHGAKVFDIPGMDLPTALTFHMVADSLRHVLPAATLEELRPWLDTAEGVLRQAPGRLGRWPGKVRVIGRGQPLLPPKIDSTVQRVVYDGVLNEQRLALTYQVKGSARVKEFEDVNPLAIVVKDQVVYLLCTMWDYDDTRQLALHRVRAASLTGERARRVAGFDLDGYIRGGAFGVVAGPPVRLDVRFARAAAAHLAETPLSADQVLREEGEHFVRVRATVPNTEELRWWLLAFGSQVEVLAPKGLRTAMVEESRAMAARYGRSRRVGQRRRA